jgi:hypothetical protein
MKPRLDLAHDHIGLKRKTRIMPMRTALKIGSVLLFCITLAACSYSNSSKTYNFLNKFDSGSITPASEPSTPTGKPVLVLPDFMVDGEKRQAMITLASAKIGFRLSGLGKHATLKFGVGMNTTLGDGAEGIITVKADKKSEVVYRRFLNPVDRAEDRKWFEESVDLSKFAGKSIQIIFETNPGPKGDGVGDWFAWSNPVLNK